MRADADNIRSHSIIFFWSKGSSESDEACILLSFDKPHQLFTVKADILTWKQQIKSISTCSRQEAEKRGGGAPGSGTGRFNCIIMWNQSQTKAFIGTLNSHLAGCSRGCLQGCWAVWAAGHDDEQFFAGASSLDLQQRKSRAVIQAGGTATSSNTIPTAAANSLLSTSLICMTEKSRKPFHICPSRIT